MPVTVSQQADLTVSLSQQADAVSIDDDTKAEPVASSIAAADDELGDL